MGHSEHPPTESDLRWVLEQRCGFHSHVFLLTNVTLLVPVAPRGALLRVQRSTTATSLNTHLRALKPEAPVHHKVYHQRIAGAIPLYSESLAGSGLHQLM